MALYKAYGSLIQSNIQLPELPKHIAGNVERLCCTFRLLPPRPGAIKEYDWFHQDKHEDGSIITAYAKHDGKYILRFPRYADFLVAVGDKNIDCLPFPEVPLETIRHLFLDRVLLSLLSQRDGVVLHGAAVVVDGGAVAFLGESGLGKSTLAASFCHSGFPLLTDDGLLIKAHGNQVICVPSYPGFRFWSESVAEFCNEYSVLSPVAHFSSKQRFDLKRGALRFAISPVPLSKIYLLSPFVGGSAKKILIERMEVINAFEEIYKGAFRLDKTSHQEIRHHFDMVSRVLVASPPQRLFFSHDFAALRMVQGAILNDLNGISGSVAV